MPCTQIPQDDIEKKKALNKEIGCIYLKFKMGDGGLEM